jgi:hypothetical protein
MSHEWAVIEPRRRTFRVLEDRWCSVPKAGAHLSLYRAPTRDWKEKMKLERRIRELEAKMISDPVVLSMPDGSRRELHGAGGFLVRLLRDVCRGADLSPGQAPQLDLIRQSVGSKEPGGGHLVELLQCLLHAQADARGNR